MTCERDSCSSKIQSEGEGTIGRKALYLLHTYIILHEQLHTLLWFQLLHHIFIQRTNTTTKHDWFDPFPAVSTWFQQTK